MPTHVFSRGIVVLIACTLAWASGAQAQTTWYVDDDAGTGGTGTSWTSPFDDLQDALDVATGSDVVHVAGGTYVPSALYDPNDPNPPTDPRNATFRLAGQVELYGGYAGLADPGNPDTRDINSYESSLDGDLAGNDGPNFTNNEENTYHVVYAFGADVTGRLDGFTITAGNANHIDAPHRDGGGMTAFVGAAPTIDTCTFRENFGYMGGGLYNNGSDPTLIDCAFEGNDSELGGGVNNSTSNAMYIGCTFTGNSTIGDGGGMRNIINASPTLIDCTFTDNSADAIGGGLINRDGCSPMLVGCVFSGNSSVTSGGGMASYTNSSPTVVNCVFSENTATTYGAGVFNRENCAPSFTNCLFAGNTATANGGGMINRVNSTPTLTNCTFSDNSAASGGAMFNASSVPTLTNCILWGDSPDEVVVGSGGQPVITYSDVQGGATGTGNIALDPAFASGYHLSAGSPCIDAANNLAVPSDVADLDGDSDVAERTPYDLDDSARFVDDPDTGDTGVSDPPNYPEVVDMGAYEFAAADCPGDLDGDNDVDLADLAQLLGNYGMTSGASYEDGDLDGDGDVDLADLAGLLGVYGTTC
jgi:hypothetical protein